MGNPIRTIEVLEECVRKAGQVIFLMTTQDLQIAYKENKNPVTTADLETYRILKKVCWAFSPAQVFVAWEKCCASD